MSKSESKLKVSSLGIVVESKPRGTDYILVSPIEQLNMQAEGTIKEQTQDYTGDKTDLESTSFKSEHESKNYVRAKWAPYSESNRTSAPDVRAGETVLIYKYADVDEYYWCDYLREPELRRQEDVLYSYSNLPNGSDSFDEETSYWVRYNTIDKYVRLHTAKNDGEPFSYDIVIDTKEGKIIITDDGGNSVELDSAKGNLSVNVKNDINLKAGGSINLEATNAINLKAQTIKEECQVKSESHQSGVSQCSGTKVIQASEVRTQANVITNNAALVKNTGNVETAGYNKANPNIG